MKEKKCRYCKEKFQPLNSLQPFCFKDECIKAHNKAVAEKKNKKIKKDLSSKYPDKSKFMAVAQTIVNRYIRLRDLNKPCCTCGHLEGRQFHAGHFECAGGNQHQRFYTLNIHKQCSICNNYKSGNLAAYKQFMIEKYGLEKTNQIINDHGSKKYTIEYLEKLIRVFRNKIKLYEKKFRS